MSNVLALIARAKNEISGPIAEAARDIETWLKRTQKASDDSSKAQEENLQRLGGAYDNALSVVRDFDGFISGKLTESIKAFSPELAIVLEIGKELGQVIAGAAEEIYGFAKRAADAGDAAFTTSQRLGVSTEFITRMGHAARLNGTNVDALERGIAKLAQGANSGSKKFEEWGIKLENNNGTLKTSEELFIEAANLIGSLDNANLKLAATQDLFGKGSKNLVPLLNEVAHRGYGVLSEEADRLAITIDSKAAAAGDRMNDALETMEGAAGGAARAFGDLFVPGITEGADGLSELYGAAAAFIREAGPGLKQAATGVGVAFRGVAEAVAWVVRVHADLHRGLTLVNDGLSSMIAPLGVARGLITATGEGLGLLAFAADDAAAAEGDFTEEVERSTKALTDQADAAKRLEKAHDIAVKAEQRIRDDYARKQEAAAAKKAAKLERLEEGMGRAVAKVAAKAEADRERLQDQRDRDRARALTVESQQREAEVRKQIADAKKAATEAQKATKETSDSAKQAIEDQLAGGGPINLIEAWQEYYARRSELQDKADHDVLQKLQASTISMANTIGSAIADIGSRLRSELATVGDIQTKSVQKIAIKSAESGGKVESYVKKISKAQIDALEAAGKKVEVVNETIELDTKTTGDAVVATITGMVDQVLEQLARMAITGAIGGLLNLATGGIAGGFGGGFLSVLGLNSGGRVPRTPGSRDGEDSVLISATPGEEVFSVEDSAKLRSGDLSPLDERFGAGGDTNLPVAMQAELGLAPARPSASSRSSSSPSSRTSSDIDRRLARIEERQHFDASAARVVNNNTFFGGSKLELMKFHENTWVPSQKRLDRYAGKSTS